MRDHKYYTALLSHDIANFNQTMKGYLEMVLQLQMGPLTDRQSRSLGRCLRQSQRIQSAIDTMRILEQVDSQPPDLEPQQLDDAIQEAAETVQQQHSEHDIRLHFIRGGRTVLAEKHLPAIFTNIFGNAARHVDKEIVEITITCEKVDGEGDASSAGSFWQILIADNGDGIPEGRKDSLFGRLEEANIHGAGLGLPLCSILLSRWGGAIWLEGSSPEGGAVFGIRIPAA